MRSVGSHLIFELWGCDDGINSPEIVEQTLRELTEVAKARLLGLHLHPFSPQGVTGVAIISESHILIHTWPELGYAAVDLFTCGEPVDPDAVVPVLKQRFNPTHVQVLQLFRGIAGD